MAAYAGWRRSMFFRAISLAVIFQLLLNDVSFALAPAPGSQNPAIRREAELLDYILRGRLLFTATAEDERFLRDLNGADALLLSHGKILAARELKSDPLKLIRTIIHEEVEAIMQIMAREEGSRYAAIKDRIIKRFPPTKENLKKYYPGRDYSEFSYDLYANHIIATAFELLIPRHNHLIEAAEVTPAESAFLKEIEPIINANKLNFFTGVFWDPHVREAKIRIAMANGLKFYQVASRKAEEPSAKPGIGSGALARWQERVSRLVEGLGYQPEVAAGLMAMANSWQDDHGEPLLDLYRRELDAAQNLPAEERSAAERRVVEGIAHTIYAQIDDDFVFDLGDVVKRRAAQCSGVTQLLYVLGNACGMKVRAIDVKELYYGPMPIGMSHVASLVDLSDGTTVMVDGTIDFVSEPFVLEQIFDRTGNVWSLNSGGDGLGIHRRFRILDTNGIIADVYSHKGAALASDGDYEGAIALLDHATELDPGLAVAYSNRAASRATLIRSGDVSQFESALQDYDAAIAISPDRPDLYYNRAHLYSAVNQVERAIDDYTTAVNIKPDLYAAYFNRGLMYLTLYYETGWQEFCYYAIADYSRCIEANPESVASAYYQRGMARLLLGEVSNISGEIDNAKDDLRQAVYLDPTLMQSVQDMYRMSPLLSADETSPKSPPDGSPWFIYNLLTTEFKGKSVTAEEIRVKTNGKISDGHLLLDTVRRDLGTLVYLGVVEQIGRGVESRYRVTDVSPPGLDKILRTLGDRPTREERERAQRELSASNISATGAIPEGATRARPAGKGLGSQSEPSLNIIEPSAGTGAAGAQQAIGAIPGRDSAGALRLEERQSLIFQVAQLIEKLKLGPRSGKNLRDIVDAIIDLKYKGMPVTIKNLAGFSPVNASQLHGLIKIISWEEAGKLGIQAPGSTENRLECIEQALQAIGPDKVVTYGLLAYTMLIQGHKVEKGALWHWLVDKEAEGDGRAKEILRRIEGSRQARSRQIMELLDSLSPEELIGITEPGLRTRLGIKGSAWSNWKRKHGFDLAGEKEKALKRKGIDPASIQKAPIPKLKTLPAPRQPKNPRASKVDMPTQEVPSPLIAPPVVSAPEEPAPADLPQIEPVSADELERIKTLIRQDLSSSNRVNFKELEPSQKIIQRLQSRKEWKELRALVERIGRGGLQTFTAGLLVSCFKALADDLMNPKTQELFVSLLAVNDEAVRLLVKECLDQLAAKRQGQGRQEAAAANKLKPAHLSRRARSARKYPPDGSPWFVYNLLNTEFKGKSVTSEEIRVKTKGRMPDGHLSIETVRRDLGTLVHLEVIEQLGRGVESRYRVTDVSPPGLDKVLRSLDGRPTREERERTKRELSASIISATGAISEGATHVRPAGTSLRSDAGADHVADIETLKRSVRGTMILVSGLEWILRGDDQTWMVAVNSLSAIYPEEYKRDATILSRLESMLRGPDPFVRWVARSSLSAIYPEEYKRDATILSRLESMLSDSKSDVCYVAAVSLSSIYPSLDVDDRARIRSRLESMLRDTESDVREAAEASLGAIYLEEYKRDATILSRLESVLRYSTKPVSDVAVSSLGAIYPEEYKRNSNILSRLELMLRDADMDVNRAARISLYAIYPEEYKRDATILSRLESMLSDSNPNVYHAAAVSLGSIYPSLDIDDGARIRSQLESMLSDSNPDVRHAAAASLSAIYPEEYKRGATILSRLESMLSDSNPNVYHAAAVSLGSIYPSLDIDDRARIRSRLESMLRDTKSGVREAAAESLGAIYLEEYRKAQPFIKEAAALFGDDGILNIYLRSSAKAGGLPETAFIDRLNMLKEDLHNRNVLLEESRRIDEESFWQEHSAKTAFLFDIMGIDAHAFLKRLLGNDPYALKRLFKSLTIYNGELIDALGALYSSLKKRDFDSFQRVLELSGAYLDGGHKGDLLDTIGRAASDGVSSEEVASGLATEYLKKTAESLDIETSLIRPETLSRFHLPYIGRLKTAMDFIRTHYPHKQGLFTAILRSTFAGTFGSFMTDTSQEDEEGRALAIHNAGVSSEIASLGVDAQRWLAYDRRESFSFSERNLATDPEDEIVRAAGYIARLYDLLPENHRTALANTLRKLSLEISSDTDAKFRLSPISVGRGRASDRVVSIFTELSNITTLEKTLGYIARNTMDSDIREAALHLDGSLADLKKLIQDPDIVKELAKKKRSLTISIWKRDPAHDLFMGDFTGCCMAANSNSHFEAMIDHLVDQGIQVAEVKDEDTGRTMALAWLFLAKDKKDQPYLVIDNIEINDSYSAIEPLKNRIKEELIAYTIEYARATGVKTVLAGMFGYSKVNIGEYRTAKYRLEKIGGYLNGEIYYLEALGSDTMRVIANGIKPLQPAHPSRRARSARKKAPDGSPWFVYNLLNTEFKGKSVTSEEIRVKTKGRMPDGHLSIETVRRDLGTLVHLEVIEQLGRGVESRYRVTDVSPPGLDKVLRSLDGRPTRKERAAAKALLPRPASQKAPPASHMISVKESMIPVIHYDPFRTRRDLHDLAARNALSIVRRLSNSLKIKFSVEPLHVLNGKDVIGIRAEGPYDDETLNNVIILMKEVMQDGEKLLDDVRCAGYCAIIDAQAPYFESLRKARERPGSETQIATDMADGEEPADPAQDPQGPIEAIHIPSFEIAPPVYVDKWSDAVEIAHRAPKVKYLEVLGFWDRDRRSIFRGVREDGFNAVLRDKGVVPPKPGLLVNGAWWGGADDAVMCGSKLDASFYRPEDFTPGSVVIVFEITEATADKYVFGHRLLQKHVDWSAKRYGDATRKSVPLGEVHRAWLVSLDSTQGWENGLARVAEVVLPGMRGTGAEEIEDLLGDRPFIRSTPLTGRTEEISELIKSDVATGRIDGEEIRNIMVVGGGRKEVEGLVDAFPGRAITVGNLDVEPLLDIALSKKALQARPLRLVRFDASDLDAAYFPDNSYDLWFMKGIETAAYDISDATLNEADDAIRRIVGQALRVVRPGGYIYDGSSSLNEQFYQPLIENGYMEKVDVNLYRKAANKPQQMWVNGDFLVFDGRDGIWISGDTGMGKSFLAIKMIESDPRYKVVSCGASHLSRGEREGKKAVFGLRTSDSARTIYSRLLGSRTVELSGSRTAPLSVVVALDDVFENYLARMEEAVGRTRVEMGIEVVRADDLDVSRDWKEILGRIRDRLAGQASDAQLKKEEASAADGPISSNVARRSSGRILTDMAARQEPRESARGSSAEPKKEEPAKKERMPLSNILKGKAADKSHLNYRVSMDDLPEILDLFAKTQAVSRSVGFRTRHGADGVIYLDLIDSHGRALPGFDLTLDERAYLALKEDLSRRLEGTPSNLIRSQYGSTSLFVDMRNGIDIAVWDIGALEWSKRQRAVELFNSRKSAKRGGAKKDDASSASGPHSTDMSMPGKAYTAGDLSKRTAFPDLALLSGSRVSLALIASTLFLCVTGCRTADPWPWREDADSPPAKAIRPEAVKGKVEELLPRIHEADASAELSKLGEPGVTAMLEILRDNNEDIALRVNAATILGVFQAVVAEPAMLQALGAPADTLTIQLSGEDWRARWASTEPAALQLAALSALAEIDAQRAEDASISLLESADPSVRQAALDLLKRRGWQPHTRYEIHLFGKVKKERTERILALIENRKWQDLERIGRETVPYIIVYGLMEERDEAVQADAAIALGRLRAEDAVFHLARILRTAQNSMTRVACAWALGEIGTPKARKALDGAGSQEKDPVVLQEIKYNLAKPLCLPSGEPENESAPSIPVNAPSDQPLPFIDMPKGSFGTLLAGAAVPQNAARGPEGRISTDMASSDEDGSVRQPRRYAWIDNEIADPAIRERVARYQEFLEKEIFSDRSFPLIGFSWQDSNDRAAFRRLMERAGRKARSLNIIEHAGACFYHELLHYLTDADGGYSRHPEVDRALARAVTVPASHRNGDYDDPDNIVSLSPRQVLENPGNFEWDVIAAVIMEIRKGIQWQVRPYHEIRVQKYEGHRRAHVGECAFEELFGADEGLFSEFMTLSRAVRTFGDLVRLDERYRAAALEHLRKIESGTAADDGMSYESLRNAALRRDAQKKQNVPGDTEKQAVEAEIARIEAEYAKARQDFTDVFMEALSGAGTPFPDLGKLESGFLERRKAIGDLFVSLKSLSLELKLLRDQALAYYDRTKSDVPESFLCTEIVRGVLSQALDRSGIPYELRTVERGRQNFHYYIRIATSEGARIIDPTIGQFVPEYRGSVAVLDEPTHNRYMADALARHDADESDDSVERLVSLMSAEWGFQRKRRDLIVSLNVSAIPRDATRAPEAGPGSQPEPSPTRHWVKNPPLTSKAWIAYLKFEGHTSISDQAEADPKTLEMFDKYIKDVTAFNELVMAGGMEPENSSDIELFSNALGFLNQVDPAKMERAGEFARRTLRERGIDPGSYFATVSPNAAPASDCLFGADGFDPNDLIIGAGRVVVANDYKKIAGGRDLVAYARDLGVKRVYFDLDLTVFRSKGYLSASAWFANAVKEFGEEQTLRYWGNYGHEQRLIDNGFFLRLMDTTLPEMIAQLRSDGIEVVGLTARNPRKDRDRTAAILERLGLVDRAKFDDVIYTAGASEKGAALDRYEDEHGVKGKIASLFVEDSFGNLKAVLDGRAHMQGILYRSLFGRDEDGWDHLSYMRKAGEALDAGNTGHAFECYFNSVVKILELNGITRQEAYSQLELIYKALRAMGDPKPAGYDRLLQIVEIAKDGRSYLFHDDQARALRLSRTSGPVPGISSQEPEGRISTPLGVSGAAADNLARVKETVIPMLMKIRASAGPNEECQAYSCKTVDALRSAGFKAVVCEIKGRGGNNIHYYAAARLFDDTYVIDAHPDHASQDVHDLAAGAQYVIARFSDVRNIYNGRPLTEEEFGRFRRAVELLRMIDAGEPITMSNWASPDNPASPAGTGAIPDLSPDGRPETDPDTGMTPGSGGITPARQEELVRAFLADHPEHAGKGPQELLRAIEADHPGILEVYNTDAGKLAALEIMLDGIGKLYPAGPDAVDNDTASDGNLETDAEKIRRIIGNVYLFRHYLREGYASLKEDGDVVMAESRPVRYGMFQITSDDMLGDVLDFGGIGEGTRVFDFGSGDGWLSYKLASCGAFVDGAEADPGVFSIYAKVTKNLENMAKSKFGGLLDDSFVAVLRETVGRVNLRQADIFRAGIDFSRYDVVYLYYPEPAEDEEGFVGQLAALLSDPETGLRDDAVLVLARQGTDNEIPLRGLEVVESRMVRMYSSEYIAACTLYKYRKKNPRRAVYMSSPIPESATLRDQADRVFPKGPSPDSEAVVGITVQRIEITAPLTALPEETAFTDSLKSIEDVSWQEFGARAAVADAMAVPSRASGQSLILYADDILEHAMAVDIEHTIKNIFAKRNMLNGGKIVLYARKEANAALLEKMIRRAGPNLQIVTILRSDIQTNEEPVNELMAVVRNASAKKAKDVFAVIRGPMEFEQSEKLAEFLKNENTSSTKYPPVIIIGTENRYARENDPRAVYSFAQAIAMAADITKENGSSGWIRMLPPIVSITREHYEAYRASLLALVAA